MNNSSSVSVLVATHNRAKVLAQTLEAFTRVDKGSSRLQWVVVDNNSSDDTRQVSRSYEQRLDLQYLFEPRPGKNCALNKAIRECTLGDIVVFTDDDVTPAKDWILQIVKSCADYPKCSVFGGRIFPEFPNDTKPSWAHDRFVQMFAFALHDYGPAPEPYPIRHYPFGPNFWIRRKILQQGFAYDERIGPRPTRRIMGSESKFLSDLEKAGFAMLYCPGAVVRHRIQSSECTLHAVRRRALRLGRGEIYLSGFPRPRLREKFRPLWIAYLYLKVAYSSVIWACSWMALSEQRRLARSVNALRTMGNSLESLTADRA